MRRTRLDVLVLFTLGIGRGVTDLGILREGIVYVTRAIEASRNELAKQRFGREHFGRFHSIFFC